MVVSKPKAEKTTKPANVVKSEEIKPEKRYLIFESGYLRFRLARGRLDPVKSRLESLRDSRKPKETPEDYAIEIILKGLDFHKKKAIEKRHVLATLKTESLDDVVEEMVEKLFTEIKFDAQNGQSTLEE